LFDNPRSRLLLKHEMAHEETTAGIVPRVPPFKLARCDGT